MEEFLVLDAFTREVHEFDQVLPLEGVFRVRKEFLQEVIQSPLSLLEENGILVGEVRRVLSLFVVNSEGIRGFHLVFFRHYHIGNYFEGLLFVADRNHSSHSFLFDYRSEGRGLKVPLKHHQVVPFFQSVLFCLLRVFLHYLEVVKTLGGDQAELVETQELHRIYHVFNPNFEFSDGAH